jgi:hypothetical protein
MNTGESNSAHFDGERSFAALIDLAELQRLRQ